MALVRALENSYPKDVWLHVFKSSEVESKIIGPDALRRVICIAVAGVEIRNGGRVHPDSEVTFEDTQNSGIFSIRNSGKSSIGGGIISIPMIAVNLFNMWTGSLPVITDSELDPFKYGWNEIEDMALASLRCWLNAAFFLNGECQVGKNETIVSLCEGPKFRRPFIIELQSLSRGGWG